MTLALTAIAFFLLSFVGTTIAAAQSENFAELAAPVYEAIMGGQYAYAAALVVVLAVALLRRYGGEKWPILSHRLVAPALVFIAAFAGALVTAWGAGAPVDLKTVWSAATAAAMGAGVYSLLKPYMAWLSSKAPAWAQPLFVLVDIVFAAKKKAAIAAEAKAAGDAAVAAKPAKGPGIDFKDIE